MDGPYYRSGQSAGLLAGADSIKQLVTAVANELDSEAATAALGKGQVNILGTQGKLGLAEWRW